jgi:hypothetical protein
MKKKFSLYIKQLIALSCLLFSLSTILYAANSPPAPLIKTGQTLCFGTFSKGEVCHEHNNLHKHQDGMVQNGVSATSVRFMPFYHPGSSEQTPDNIIGYQDTLTGLVWSNRKTVNVYDGNDEFLSWEDASRFANMVYPSQMQWRIPNRNEMLSIISFNKTSIPVPTFGEMYEIFQESVNRKYLHKRRFWTSSINNKNGLILGYKFLEGVDSENVQIYSLASTNTTEYSTGNINVKCLVWAVSGPHQINGQDAPAPIAKTGQKTTYDSEGNIMNCEELSGLEKFNCQHQDGYLQIGVEWPSPRFKNLNDGTIIDLLTGLMWLQDLGCLGGANGKNWEEALDVINIFNNDPNFFECINYSKNYSDWVFPNILELNSLLSLSHESAQYSLEYALPLPIEHFFINIPEQGLTLSSTSSDIYDPVYHQYLRH